MNRALVLTVGDEILMGQILDTNSQWLSEQLTLAGVEVVLKVSVGDHTDALKKILDFAFLNAEVVLITGGLGPTKDDLTKAVLADWFGVPLEIHPVALKSLETAALTARSGTSDEARLRAEEAGLILQWVERAKAVEPRGQVVIPETSGRDDLLLENGDVIRVPMRDGLVLVNGEVLFPNAVTHEAKLNLQDYIKRAGGYTQNADAARVLIAHKDGSFTEADQEEGFFKLRAKPPKVNAGDEILVLPKLDVKSRQILKDLTQIIFQIAVSAKVVLGL